LANRILKLIVTYMNPVQVWEERHPFKDWIFYLGILLKRAISSISEKEYSVYDQNISLKNVAYELVEIESLFLVLHSMFCFSVKLQLKAI
jgi:hypothetical protein